MDGEDFWAVIGLICVFAKKVSEVYSSVPSGYTSVNVTGIVLVNNSQDINVSRNVSGCAAFVWHPPNPPLLATNPQWDAYYVPPPPPPPSPVIQFHLPERSNVWVSMNGLVRPDPELEEPFYLHKVYVDKDILQRLRQQLWQRLSDLLRVTNALNFDLWNSEVSVQANKETQFLLISNKGNERMLLGTKPHWSSYYQPHWSSYQKPRLEIVDNRSIVTAIPEQKRVNRNERVISLQVRNDSNFFEISNVTFSEWEEINERDKRIRKLHRLERVLEISNVTFSEWEEINEHYKRIRQLHRLPTKEILPIRLLSFFYSLATQVLQQFNRVVAEVQLVVYEAFNYVSLLFLCPILAVLCCLVKCKDDRTSLCWVLKLVSKCHPISGLCVYVCDKIVDSSNHTQPPQSTVRVSDQIVDSSQPTQPPQKRVRFADEIMESPTPAQPLSSGPDGGLKKETMEEMKARLLATFKKIRSEC